MAEYWAHQYFANPKLRDEIVDENFDENIAEWEAEVQAESQPGDDQAPIELAVHGASPHDDEFEDVINE